MNRLKEIKSIPYKGIETYEKDKKTIFTLIKIFIITTSIIFILGMVMIYIICWN